MKIKPSLPILSSHHASLGETVRVLNERRRMLKMLGGVGALALVSRNALACTLIPEETAGPYPGDGSNGPNVLTQSGVVRSDIRSSFGASGTNTAAGTTATITLQLVSMTSGCEQLEGLAVYIWHCNATGGYSMYSSGVTNENYLRGVQITDANGQVTFTSIFPGCYSGRWPHIHFEIYSSLDDITSGADPIRTSQLALPEDACRLVYAQTSLYPNSTNNLNQISLETDNVFSDDGGVTQIATVTGDNTNGYAASLEVGVAVDASSTDLVFADGFD